MEGRSLISVWFGSVVCEEYAHSRTRVYWPTEYNIPFLAVVIVMLGIQCLTSRMRGAA